jgi:predicted amidohydrolase YtcJ
MCGAELQRQDASAFGSFFIDQFLRFGVTPSATPAARIGAVKPGYFADLLVVRGDPVSSITATRSVALVIKSGRIVWHDAAREL